MLYFVADSRNRILLVVLEISATIVRWATIGHDWSLVVLEISATIGQKKFFLPTFLRKRPAEFPWAKSFSDASSNNNIFVLGFISTL